MVNGTGISFSGLASGLDTNAIVQQLVALERIPIQLIEDQKSQQQAKLDKLNAFADLVNALKDKAEELGDKDSFFSFAVSGNHEGVAAISATGGAAAGTHSLNVLNLANVDRWAFDGVADSTVDLATGGGQTISFEIGTTAYSIEVPQDGSSLDEIAVLINEVAGDDVQASVVNTGTESAPSYQLVLASDESGSDNRLVNISSTVAGLTIDYQAADANGDAVSANHLTVGANAVAVIDGLTISRSTNDFSDVFDGMSIDLQGVTDGPVLFTVEADKEAIQTQVEEFITAYNDVMSFINTQSTYTPPAEDGEAGNSGVLFGDSILNTVRTQLRSSLFDVDLTTILNDTTGFATLYSIGIEQNTDGTLEFDKDKFGEKLGEDLDLLADLLVDFDGFTRDPDAEPNTSAYYEDTTSDSGLLATLARNIDRLFGNLPDNSDDIKLRGIFDLRRDSINDRLDSLNDQIEAKERRLEQYEQDLILRFARLEDLMSSLNAQGSALANGLG